MAEFKRLRFDETLFGDETDFGKEKIALLNSQGVIALHFEGQAPPHRISWEALKNLVATSKECQAEAMRQAKTARAQKDAARFEELPTVSPEELFVNGTISALERRVADYAPENGFDLDLFVLAPNPDDCSTVEVHREVFPRRLRAKPATEVASKLWGRDPFVFFGDFGRDNPIGSFLCAELMTGTQPEPAFEARLAAANEIIARYLAHQGLWYLREPAADSPWLFSAFIHRCILSITEARLGERKRTIIHPGVARDYRTGAVKSAKLSFSRRG